MGCRYQKATDRENEVSFRVVEIFIVSKYDDKGDKSSKFLLVDNRQETLEAVQNEIHAFVRTAIMANRLGEQGDRTNFKKGIIN
ncbi:MAG: hypothetical protein HXX17_06610 [Geobacteraceae bacterium]|nr:hypothetical protein [Geobacteraceae bacterium]